MALVKTKEIKGAELLEMLVNEKSCYDEFIDGKEKEDFNYYVLFGVYGIVVFVAAKYLISSYKTTTFLLNYFTYILLSIVVIYIIGKVLKKVLK